ncbi:MAG: hypothetical protein J6C75_07150 [Oscillospiraceae bacterium]|nr:hypothetical protein [Oscillospiraceae bacterium]
MLFSEQKPDMRLINPLTLAFVGDGVYEMLVREEIVRRHTSLSAKKLHALTVEMVRATAQCRGYELIAPHLTEEETSIFKRGRNSNGITAPKHTSVAQYRVATGLEALFGWLYLSGESERIRELFQIILDGEENAEQQPVQL